MSLVLGYANKDIAIIMSDGRAGGTVSPSEIYDKTRKINDNIIMGFVGYRETGEHFLNCVYTDMQNRIESCFIDEFLEEVEYGISLDVTREKMRSTFMIIGRTEKREIISIIAGNSTNYKVEKKIVCDSWIRFVGGVIDRNIIYNIYMKNMSNKKMSIENCMRKTITEVSQIDNSINNNIFMQII